MSAENSASVYSTPAMTAEAETEMLSETTPVRISGFAALFLGLLSFTALLGAPMIIVPVAAVLTALVSLRPYRGLRPLGYRAGMIGLFAGVLFGAWGATANQLRTRILSEQAVQFSEDWLNLVAQGDLELAVELQVDPSRRQAASMSLKEYYTQSEEGRSGMKLFREIEPVEELIAAGDRVRWELAGSPAVYKQNTRQKVRTQWRDQSGAVRQPVAVTLEYLSAADSMPAQWKVDAIDYGIEGASRI
jgi:hypothetical protein